MDSKTKKRKQLFEYLSNPDNEFLSRTDLALTVLKYSKPQSIYTAFTPNELTEIEIQALDERKRRSSGQRAKVYLSLYNEAIAGNVHAIKEFLDRTEGKVTSKIEHTGKEGGPIEFSDIERAKRLNAILDTCRERRSKQADSSE